MVYFAVTPLLILTLMLPAVAGADLFLRYLPYPPPAEGKIYDNLDVYVSRGKVLMTGESHAGVTYSVWYDSADGVFRVHDARQGGYYRLDIAVFSGLVAQQHRYRRDMEAKLAATPDAERSAMRDALEQFERSVFGGAPPKPFEYKNTGVRGMESGIECVEHEVLQLGRPVRLLCIADLHELGASNVDIAILDSMARDGTRIAFGTRRGFQLMPIYPLDFKAGFTVRIVYLDSGRELRLNRLDLDIPQSTSLDSYKQQRELPLQLNQ